MDNKKSSIWGFDANLLLVCMYAISLILYFIHGFCYFGWIIPLLVYVFESDNNFVKKQSSQAIILFLLGSIFSLIVYLTQVAIVPVTYVEYANVTLSGFRLFLSHVSSVVYVMGSSVIVILSLIAIVRLYSYNDYVMPIVGDYLERFRVILDKVVGNSIVEDTNIEKGSSNITIGDLVPNDKYNNKESEKR